jgi:hypothetical protein
VPLHICLSSIEANPTDRYCEIWIIQCESRQNRSLKNVERFVVGADKDIRGKLPSLSIASCAALLTLHQATNQESFLVDVEHLIDWVMANVWFGSQQEMIFVEGSFGEIAGFETPHGALLIICVAWRWHDTVPAFAFSVQNLWQYFFFAFEALAIVYTMMSIVILLRVCRTADRFDSTGMPDHVVVFGECHLRHLLLSYMKYYNGTPTHLALEKDAPFSRTVERAGQILCRPILAGQHHQYVRI